MSSSSARSDGPRLNSSRSELRKSVRKRAHYQALIRFAGGVVECDCALADVSDGGAKLAISSPHEIPDEFTLVLSERYKLIHRCSVVWRADGYIGVRFLKDAPAVEGAATAEAPDTATATAEAPASVSLDC